VPNPALWAAKLLRQALVAKGIKIDGETRSRDFRTANGETFDPTKAVELAAVDSETLGEAVRETNKQSNNLYAELILRTLGKEKGAAAPDPDPRKNAGRGDDEAGVAVVSSWLKSHDIDADKLAIRDGSGLSRLDLVSPESTGRLLAAIANTNSASLFHDSLSIAGRDGTLAGRLSNVRDQVFAKTGTVFYVHSLSGYATRENGETLAFSIFCNDALGRPNPIRVVDRIASLISGDQTLTLGK
jgi:serine-type D-Ala-D-Ala carboxypeptidase/endopeptidase (penicillin-binding protein 4)